MRNRWGKVSREWENGAGELRRMAWGLKRGRAGTQELRRDCPGGPRRRWGHSGGLL